MAKRVDESAWRREGPELVRGLRARRPDVRAHAIARICELFDPLVKMQARGYRYYGAAYGTALDLADLEQVARVGLLEAIATFRPARGAFPTHAMWTIRNALSKHIENLANPVKLPAWMIRRLAKFSRVHTRLAHVLGREPHRSELAAALGMSEAAIDDMRIYDQGPAPLPYEVIGVPASNPNLLWSERRARNRMKGPRTS